MRVHQWFRLFCALAVATALSASSASAQVTKFSTDVTSAIDAGFVPINVAFANPSPAGNAAGLVALALLEKRASADPSSPSLGYSGATAADKAKLDLIMAYIIARADAPQTFYSYRDGADMMALSVYLRTGGPDTAGALKSLNDTFDRTNANQGVGALSGYWCYTAGNCADASTTQLVVAGLAAARSVYLSGPFADAVRLAQLNTLAANTRAAYASIPAQAPVLGVAGTERGHGYNRGNTNSLQQTASGLWVQLVGGADINDPKVQAYLEWLRNRYDYPDQANANGGWAASAFYYLWTAAKAFEFLETAGVPAAPGNLDTSKIGILPGADAPVFAGRLVHDDPATVPRVPKWGAQGAGYYNEAAEPARWYFDFAYRLMLSQDVNGNFNGGAWEYYSNQAYALLVLQRSVGGGCLDNDEDTICNDVDNCVAVKNPGQEDGDNDGIGDACDVAEAKIKLNVSTGPGKGYAGVTNVTATGGGWPAGAIPPAGVNIYVGPVCWGMDNVATTATKLTTVIGATRKAQFKIPAGVAPGANFVWLSGAAQGGFASTNCSKLMVLAPPS